MVGCDIVKEDIGPAATINLKNDTLNIDVNATGEINILLNDDFTGNAMVELGQPVHGKTTLSNDGKKLIYTAATGYVGLDSLTYKLCVGKQCQEAKVFFRVSQNCLLKAFDDHLGIWENSEYFYWIPLRENDDTCGTVTTTITRMPAHGKAMLDAFSKVYYRPEKNYTGPDQITYTICNPDGQCSEAIVYLTVKKDLDFESCRDKFEANADKAAIERNSNLSNNFVDVDVLSNDILCNAIRDRIYLQVSKQPQKGLVEVILDSNNRSKFRYVTLVNGPATDTFRYKICYKSKNQIEEVCKEAEVEIVIP